MKNKINFPLLLLGTLLVFASCKKDRTVVYVNQSSNDSNKNNTGHVATSFRLNSAGFLKTFAPQAEKFNLDASTYMMIISASGNRYLLPANCLLHQDNSPVTGTVEFRLTEYRTKADMLRSGVTTLSDKELLASGSMFHLTAYQNQEELKVKDNTSMGLSLIPNSNNSSPMDYWVGIQNTSDSNNTVDWVLNNPVQIRPQVDSGSLKKTYNFSIPKYKFGYSNLDCLHNSGNPRCKTWTLDPPDNCNDTNSMAMIIMDQYHACGYAFWASNVKLIGTHYQLPVGEKYKLLIYRKHGSGDDDIEYVILDKVLEEDNQVVYKGAMTKTTKAGFNAILNGF